ncbi:tyrosine-protein phosphatase [Amycolatopsis jejuensis]|uniref:tyrosine-protein phosphatase n=1 Tax=Amycolatopsis jejuensis TaxID=330084 RepID=UPI00052560FB|nr:tyrosine-protein phosphatase [Amycolatopsis jejuensis]
MNRAVRWEGFFNTRDLGGLPTRSGGRTAQAGFYRAADLRFVTDAGWRQARESGVRTIVDLRNAAEITTPGATGICRIEVPLDGVEDVAFWRHIAAEQLDGSPLYYRLFLEQKADRCAAVLTALARAEPGGVLFHCGAGRDRTGLIALLLLALADVEPEAIAADYDLSAEAVRPLFAALGVEDQSPVIKVILESRGTTTRQAILDVLSGFDPEQYLLHAGMHPKDVNSLRNRLR